MRREMELSSGDETSAFFHMMLQAHLAQIHCFAAPNDAHVFTPEASWRTVDPRDDCSQARQ